MSKKIDICENGSVNIKWHVMPFDYSPDKTKTIAAKFAKKYGIPKGIIKVEPVLILKNSKGEDVTVTESVLENINDPKYQQDLFRKYIEINEIKNYDFSKILDIDSLINSKIDYELYDKHKRYTLKWIKWSNFMSYGANNFFDFSKVDGLTLLTSQPANQGGKSTFCLDLFRFLLFGKVTSRESDWTLASVFNSHLPEATEVSVEGCVCIDNTDYVIRRVITRPKLEKRTDKSKVTQKLNYYKLVNDEYVDLEDEENQNEVGNRETNKAIKDAIGNERDFDLMICVNQDNLKGLISLKDTERGRLISRWIGLLPLEDKDKIARETYNKSVAPSLLSNKYNKEEVSQEIAALKDEIKSYDERMGALNEKEELIKSKITALQKTRDTLMQSKQPIDSSLTKTDVVTVETAIRDITERGKRKRTELNDNTQKLNEIGDISFNEEEYRQLEKECTEINISLAEMREKATACKNSITALEKGEFCPTCGARLKNVDNSKAIEAKKKELDELIDEGKKKSGELKGKNEEKENKSKDRELYNQKIRLQLTIEKNNVDLQNIAADYREKQRLLKDINDNKSAIEKNNRIDLDIMNADVSISNENSVLKGVQDEKNVTASNILADKKRIEECDRIIETLTKEESVIANWKLYMDMVGKYGISKLVIRTVLPYINGELKRLLNGVCDFDVEVTIDDHNDVAFNMIHDGVSSKLASGSGLEQTVASLALRSVLNRISTFSKPSFVVFDEVLGGVADENYEQVKKLFDKMADDYDVVLQISHLKQIYEWHKHIVTIKKENNISKIEMS